MNSIWGEAGSPKVALIKKINTDAGYSSWTNDQVGRLCQRIGCTLHELCAISGVYDRARIQRFWDTGRWPSEVAIHLAKLDNFLTARAAGGFAVPETNDAVIAKLINKTL